MYGDSHVLVYMLDPHLRGEGLPQQNRSKLEGVLVSTPFYNIFPVSISRERQEAIYIQYTEFRITADNERKNKTFPYEMLESGLKTPLQYWQTDGSIWPELQQIAMKLFSMATSSASSERNWSRTGSIHSKLRNSLSVKSVEKLVYIKTTLPAFYDTPAKMDDIDVESSHSDDE
jgi:hAT family C-terminal dimerisation region